MTDLFLFDRIRGYTNPCSCNGSRREHGTKTPYGLMTRSINEADQRELKQKKKDCIDVRYNTTSFVGGHTCGGGICSKIRISTHPHSHKAFGRNFSSHLSVSEIKTVLKEFSATGKITAVRSKLQKPGPIKRNQATKRRKYLSQSQGAQ
jgi:hypothetical protein